MATLEDSPKVVKPPRITGNNSTTLMIYWTKPEQPNGFLTKYILYNINMGTAEMLPPSQLKYIISGMRLSF